MQARELIQTFIEKVITFQDTLYTAEDQQYLFNLVLDLVGKRTVTLR